MKSRPHQHFSCAIAQLIVTAATTAALAGCVSTVTGSVGLQQPIPRLPTTSASPPTPAAAPAVDVADLPRLLLDLNTVQDQVGSTAMEAGATDHGVSGLDPGDRYEPPDCVSTMVWGMDSAYAGLNALGAYGQTYRDPGAAGGHDLAEMVVAFPDARAAANAAQRMTDQWRACAGRQVSETRADGATSPQWTIAPTVVIDGVATLQRRPSDSKRWACARYMAAKSNIVVDGLLCSYDLADRPLQIAKAILGRIPS
jgi:hypothetical protein